MEICLSLPSSKSYASFHYLLLFLEPSLKLFIDKAVSLTEIYYRYTFGNSFDLIEFIQLFVFFTTCHKYYILIYGCKVKDLSAIYLERN